jgi:hypothetical protein
VNGAVCSALQRYAVRVTQNTLPRKERCYRCGFDVDFPILVSVRESGAGPGAMIYACLRHANADFRSHCQHCSTCVANEVACPVAREMRLAILDARNERLKASMGREGGQ